MLLLIPLFAQNCRTLPPAKIGGAVTNTIHLTGYQGSPYLIDVANANIVIYTSLPHAKAHAYIKYRVDLPTGACTELSRETGAERYKNYFWDSVSENKKSGFAKFCSFFVYALMGLHKKEYGIELTKKLDDAHTVQYRFQGNTTSVSRGQGNWISDNAGSARVYFKRGDALQSMTPNHPLNIGVWQYPLAGMVDYPFLSKFYYLDKSDKRFILSFPDGSVLIGDIDMLSLKQRVVADNDGATPYVDLAVDKDRRVYYWLCARKNGDGVMYSIEVRSLDSIVAVAKKYHWTISILP